ncbi:tRNA uridine-5-carboxymethylaminomethyl(34) synthesis enzyme MnmG [Candidatus Vidania fulgoroideae]|uniref:tRNA uridine 5-carboxymethylaminomethyl modification enzyme MnmG n=1 Tax=Candidatus Vidania fulgoroideorum TaxID=881286 RepID=A0A975AEB6_9PROT|nr:tRNA uridine-5-carboxymethylaminomethyl(34) synthesis enzyme MnmG [Candidatus Vidania fulgoroideae]
MTTEILVIGGGHAGIEAAHISAKLGAKTTLITSNIDSIGKLSCNPAIGGIGKSHLIHEINVLGGLMGQLADNARLVSKTLNSSKGKAVRATRIQVDKDKYSRIAINILMRCKNLKILQQSIIDLIIHNNKVTGVITESGLTITATVIILTIGTFLNCNTYIGNNKIKKARDNEDKIAYLHSKLKHYISDIYKFKTGTPPRLKAQSLNKNQLTVIKSDTSKPFFYRRQSIKTRNYCWETHTNTITHQIIKHNIKKSAAYNGIIKHKGPRYCLSIEDKVIRFPQYNQHTLFLELENLNTQEIYVGGLATSFDTETQHQIIHSIKGLQNAEITRYGYGITYNYINPQNLKRTLESKYITNLFIAGQINGTSGYEEAAAQGIIAGINAYKNLHNKQHLILSSKNSYIGILIKDITQNGVEEPYRMFTSRAKNRLIMRADNTIFRLSKQLLKVNLISKQKYKKIQATATYCKKFITKAHKIYLTLNNKKNTLYNILLNNKHNIKTLYSIAYFKKKVNKYFKKINLKMLNYIESEIKYKGYYKTHTANIKENTHVNITNIKNLANETKELIARHNATTFKAIKQIKNIRSACIENIANYIRKTNKLS